MDPNNVRVAVSGLRIYGSRGPGAGVARALRASGDFTGEIVGIAYDTHDLGDHGDGLCNCTYAIPYPPENTPMKTLWDTIEEIQNRTPVDVIVPTLGAEIAGFTAIAGDLERMGISLCLPGTDTGLQESRSRFHQTCRDLQISVPAEVEAADPEIGDDFGQELQFPVILKSRFDNTIIAFTPSTAEHLLKIYSYDWKHPVSVREFIVGDRYDAVALGDGRGGCIGAVPVKLISFTGGVDASAGTTASDPAILDFIGSVIGKLKWGGPCWLKMVRRGHDGELFLLRIIGGFPEWAYLSAVAGQNLAWASVQLALGRRIAPLPSCSPNMFFMMDSGDIIYSDEGDRGFSIGGAHRRLTPGQPNGRVDRGAAGQ
ncbi:MAG: hypothetical protein JXA20_10715 [Spirochaetes bacterium]|nr:hypothetical protein [Spirochaetota bacterium]